MTDCARCATELQQNAKFCFECGAPVEAARRTAEYKHVTVLFADVVHSMHLAAEVGAERLREIMAGLFDRSVAVVQRFGGTVISFTGDGIMAVFGAPVALEDHAFRACLAALEIQRESSGADDVALQLRVGLNSGEVVAGEVGAGSYTAVGEQVGMAQRMESVAPPGGVMLSASTARLVEDIVTLGDAESVHIKGVIEPVPARRLLAAERRRAARQDPSLVGRTVELGALAGMLDQAVDGSGCVSGIVGPPGIGKSRIVREVTALAQQRGVEVFATYCEAHAREIPFHTATALLRTALGTAGLDHDAARARVRERAPDADPQDLLLLDGLVGISDSGVDLSAIDPDARRRRLTRLVNTVSLARTTPAVFVVEDVHWIDDVSEALLTEFLTVLPRTPSLVVITYRPEYHGALIQAEHVQVIALAPLSDSQSAVLTTGLIGSDPSVAAICGQVVERAAGNPFFAEELVRDLVERGVLTGSRGHYLCHADRPDVTVPATVQATIAARIDRLEPAAKRALNAAAVIGLRFNAEQLGMLVDQPEINSLLAAELVEQVGLTSVPDYAFHHALIRAVAYESQLRSDRAELHRCLANAIEQHHPDSLEENAALIAEHCEAAGDLPAAYGWHMRAGAWAQFRDIGAARLSWERAQAVADRLPADAPDRPAMRIAARTLLCGSTWRVSGTIADAGFDELRDLCTEVGDTVSLAMGMAGLVTALVFHNRFREASCVASDLSRLLDSIDDPMLTLALAVVPSLAQWQAGAAVEGLQMAQRTIDLAEGDLTKGALIIASPLATAIGLRGSNRYSLGLPGWKADLDRAIELARSVDPTTYVVAVAMKYGHAVHVGAVLPDAAAERDTAEALELAEHFGDDFTLDFARLARALVLAQQAVAPREAALALLTQYREAQLRHGYAQSAVEFADTEIARERARTGDLDGAIQLARPVVNYLFDVGGIVTCGEATSVLVEVLLHRGADGDLDEAQAAVDRLAAVPVDAGFVLFEIPLLRLRALLARANGDEHGYRVLADRYLMRATDIGYEGHIALAEAMT